jgi:GH24 family phage-related lysozyme (muramidase)
MLFDKRKGSLLNYIQLPLNVVTPNGTYLGTGYKETGEPTYILSHVRLTCFPITDLIFSEMSKNAIIDTNKPMLEITDDTVGFGYKITNTEKRYGYITVASQRIDIGTGKITKPMANFILEKQLRNIGNVLEKFVKKELSQPQFDALLYYFFNEGVDKIEGHPIIALINNEKWYNITDEIQTNIKKNNGQINEKLAAMKIKTSKMWSFVPGFS